MDLAQSILQELITLQKKNEELARIIGKLEIESDVIIQQFEHKIEELQKALKHEQEDKSRASRRYEAELRDLEGTKDALIKEISEVRDTYQSSIQQLNDRIAALTQSAEIREKEHIEFRVERERDISDLKNQIDDLQVRLSDSARISEKEISDLSSRIGTLTDTLQVERQQFKEIILRKDGDIQITRDHLHTLTQHLHEAEVREKTRDEESRSIIDHLNYLIHSERQIRNRELKERDERVRQYEEEIAAAQENINRSRKQSETEISRLNHTNAESLLRIAGLQKENLQLSSGFASLTDEYDLKLKTLTQNYSEEKDTFQHAIVLLNNEIQSGSKKFEEEIRIRDEELGTLRDQITKFNEQSLKEQTEREKLIDGYTHTINALESEKEHLTGKLERTLADHSDVTAALSDFEAKIESERRSLNDTIEDLQGRLSHNELTYQQEIKKSREELSQTLLDRDQISDAKQKSDEFYRGEISGLHDEISEIEERMRAREEELLKELAQRETQFADTSTNNEALRAEIDRIRLQYIRLQETIRAEKDESVHALYREITTLEDQLTGKEAEISSLTEKVLRLDAENTRLLQTISQTTGQNSYSPSVSRKEKGIIPSEETPAPILDPRRREIIAIVADLEDPARAPEAAEKLTAMGGNVVDLLIPLLHTGSIQRRVWIAVVLYEINDNRATLPLMKLLEIPKVHFRELIWEAKNQYHTRVRMGTGPVEPAGVKAGYQKTGPFI